MRVGSRGAVVALASVCWIACSLSAVRMAQADDPRPPRRVTLFAAASLTDVLEELRDDFQEEHPDTEIDLSFGSSSNLAVKIERGAEADLFFSASLEWIDYLSEKDMLAESKKLVGNELVAILPVDSQATLDRPDDLLHAHFQHLALADPEAVPAGKYARQALESLDLWTRLSGRVVPAIDVRQALSYVEMGAAEAGIVYATDAAASQRVKLAFRFDRELCDPIEFPLGITPAGIAKPQVLAFVEFLQSDEACRVFERHGFHILDQTAAKPEAPEDSEDSTSPEDGAKAKPARPKSAKPKASALPN